MSEADIANLSLGRLHIGQSITSLSEKSTPAVVCNRFFKQCRQEVLRSFPWSFASAAVALAQEADQTYPGWRYVYGYPDSALRVWAVADSAGIRSTVAYYSTRTSPETYDQSLRFKMPFQVALRADYVKRVILSDMPSAYAFMTYDVSNTGVFPPDFNSVLAWRLAMEVGGPLKADRKLVAEAENKYLLWQSRATATDMNESRDDVVPESESISCRY